MQKPLQLIVKKAHAPLPSKRQAILILGMHRSGTSALGGVVSMLGAAAPKTLLPGNTGNPRGYWECLPLERANNDLLASAGSRWDDWRPLNPRWIDSEVAKHFRRRIIDIIVDEFADQPLFFIKDPRMCRLVPLMLSILDELNISPVVLLPVRNPLEVAHSLKRRDGIPLPKSLLLWLRHVLDAEYHSRNIPRYFLSHEEFLVDWRLGMDRAAEKTGIIWPARSDGSDAKIEQFLTMDLYHERFTVEDIQNHPNITSLVRATYDTLSAIAANGESTGMLAQLDLLRTKFDEGCDLFGAAVAAEEFALEQSRVELGARVAEVAALRQGNLELMAQSEQQALHVRDLGAERDGLAAVNADLTAEREALAAARSGLIAERDALAAANADLTAERGALAAARSGLVAERDALAAANADLTAERDGLAATRSGLIAERYALAAENADLTSDREALARAHSDLVTQHEALANLIAERDALTAAHGDLIAERDALTRAHSDLAAERDALLWAHDDLAKERDALTRVPGELIAERDAFARTHGNLVSERDALARGNADLATERDTLARAHADLIAERDGLLRDRNRVAGERDTLFASRSWRLTAPLRRVRKLFTLKRPTNSKKIEGSDTPTR